MTMKKLGRGFLQQQVQLVIPVAVLCDIYGVAHTLRVALCTVLCTQLQLNTDAKRDKYVQNNAVNVLPCHYIERIKINRILETGCRGISLRDMTQDRVLRKQLISNETPGSGAILHGVHEITYIYDNGAMHNPGIYYPVLSRAQNAITLHGFFDYTGAWHAGRKEIPSREPYMTELGTLNNRGAPALYNYMMQRLRDERADGVYDVKTCMATLSMEGEGACHTYLYTPPLVNVATQISSLAAAQCLTQAPTELLDANLRDRDLFLLNTVTEADLPAISWIAGNKQRVTINTRSLHPVDTAQHTFVLPPAVTVLDIKSTRTLTLQGIENNTLSNYSVYNQILTQYTLPKAIACTPIDYTPGVELITGLRAMYLGPELNLHAICTDLMALKLDLRGQCWDTVILPTAGFEAKYKGTVERARQSIRVFRCNTLYNTEGCFNDFNVELQLKENEALEKVVTLDFRPVQHWRKLHVAMSSFLTSEYPQWNARHHTVNTLLGLPGKGSCLLYETDCTLTDNIYAPCGIEQLSCTLHSTTLLTEQHMPNAGVMTVQGNVEELVLFLDGRRRRVATKHIYVTGTLKRVQFYMDCDDTVANIKVMAAKVRIHVKGDVMPRVNTYGYTPLSEIKKTQSKYKNASTEIMAQTIILE